MDKARAKQPDGRQSGGKDIKTGYLTADRQNVLAIGNQPVWRDIMAERVGLRLLSATLFFLLLQTEQLSGQIIYSDDSAEQTESISEQQPNNDISSQMPASGRSLKDSVVLNPRNMAGFSIGLFGLYDSIDLGENQPSNEESYDLMILPTVFLNLGKRKTQFHADYSLEQRLFNRSDDSSFHTGNLGFLYTPSRHWTINVSDELRYAPSDLLSLTGGFSPGLPIENPIGPGISGYSYERVFMNRASGDVSYELNRKTRVSAFGNSQLFRYESNDANDTDAYNVGARLGRTLSRKLDASISFVYGHYGNLSGLRDDRIKRLSGGLGYQIDRFWRVYGNAGVQWVDTPGFSYTPTYFSAAVDRTTDSSAFSVSYTRSAQYQLGTPLLTNTDTVSLSFDQRLTQKSSLLLGAHYYRSELFAESDPQNTFITGAGFKYLLHSNIMASVNGNYQYQDQAFYILNSPSLNRYYVYAGVEFIIPGVRRR